MIWIKSSADCATSKGLIQIKPSGFCAIDLDQAAVAWVDFFRGGFTLLLTRMVPVVCFFFPTVLGLSSSDLRDAAKAVRG